MDKLGGYVEEIKEKEKILNVAVVDYLRSRTEKQRRKSSLYKSGTVVLACPEHSLTLNSSACWTFGSSQIKWTNTL